MRKNALNTHINTTKRCLSLSRPRFLRAASAFTEDNTPTTVEHFSVARLLANMLIEPCALCFGPLLVQHTEQRTANTATRDVDGIGGRIAILNVFTHRFMCCHKYPDGVWMLAPCHRVCTEQYNGIVCSSDFYPKHVRRVCVGFVSGAVDFADDAMRCDATTMRFNAPQCSRGGLARRTYNPLHSMIAIWPQGVHILYRVIASSICINSLRHRCGRWAGGRTANIIRKEIRSLFARLNDVLALWMYLF